MRELQIASWGDIVLWPATQAASAPPEAEESDPFEERREYYSNLLNDQVSDKDLGMLP